MPQCERKVIELSATEQEFEDAVVDVMMRLERVVRGLPSPQLDHMCNSNVKRNIDYSTTVTNTTENLQKLEKNSNQAWGGGRGAGAGARSCWRSGNSRSRVPGRVKVSRNNSFTVTTPFPQRAIPGICRRLLRFSQPVPPPRESNTEVQDTERAL